MATIWGYGFLIIMLAGLPLLYLLIYLIDPSFNSSTLDLLLAPNPLTILVMYSSDRFNDLWQPLLTMAFGCGVVLTACVFIMRRQRGARSLVPHRVSLEVARFNSRKA